MSGPTGQAAAAQLDSLAGRWRYLPRLLRLLWRVAPWELALIGTVSVASGLLPLAGLFILRGLVDSTVDLITGDGRLTTALLWVAALLCLDLLENAFYEAYDWLSLEVHDRIAARVEERLLRRAGTLSLAAFERPDLYDQLHRARQALDTRLHQSLGSLFRAPARIATVVAVLAFLAAAHPALPLVILAGMIPLNVVTLAVFRKVWILTRAQTESERTLEYLSGLMTKRDAAAEVRLFGLGRYFRDRRQRLSSRLRRERYDLGPGARREGQLDGGGRHLGHRRRHRRGVADDPAGEPHGGQLRRVSLSVGARPRLDVGDRVSPDVSRREPEVPGRPDRLP